MCCKLPAKSDRRRVSNRPSEGTLQCYKLSAKLLIFINSRRVQSSLAAPAQNHLLQQFYDGTRLHGDASVQKYAQRRFDPQAT